MTPTTTPPTVFDDPRVLAALEAIRLCELPGDPERTDKDLLPDAVFLAAWRECRPRWAAA